MKKILFNLIIIIALLGNMNIAEAQYAHPATAIKTTDGNVQTDLNTLQANIGASTVEVGLITAEIALIQANLSTMEASLTALVANDATQEIEIAAITAEIDLMQTNLSTLEDLVDSNHAWTTGEIATITAEIALIQTNLSTIETLLNEHSANFDTIELELADITAEINLINGNLETIETRLDEHYANLETHELSINALITNDQTQETRIASTEVGLARHENNTSNPHSVTATQTSYVDTYLMGVTDIQAAIDTMSVWLSSIDVTNDSQDVSIEANRLALVDANIELDSIAVAINNLDLRLGAIELILAGGSSGEVLTKTDDSFTWETIPAGVTDHLLLSNIGTKTHLELEQDILDLQANPAGISRVYIDGVALPTGEVEFVAGSGINLNITGSTVEIESTSTGSGGTVEAILSQNYVARSQGTAEIGFFSIYDFDITSSIIVTGTVVPTINGLVQYETTHFTIGTWDDGGTNKLRITFANDVASDALVRVSCFTTLPLLAVISADNVSTDSGWLQDGLDAIWVAINDRYTKAETNATIEAAIAAIPSGGGTAIEDVGTYIESNTTWEFDAEYDTTAVVIYRNRIYQPRSLFTTVDVSSKTRVVFTSAINASDEIILISNK